jgi:acetyltransferase
MSIRSLDSMFDPSSVAVIGASERPVSVGGTVWRNVREGGFRGPIWAVNPRHAQLGGEPCHADVASLPGVPELGVICTPPASVPGLIEALGARGTRAAVVLTAGLDGAQRQAMLDAARRHLLRIIGPNCLGLLSPHAGLNASFSHTGVSAGSLAFVSQSGALVTAVLDWARGRGIGFSHCISLGEHADVDFGDLIDWLASDARTRSILLYVESITSARKFMSAARAAARNKPVLVVKAGRSPLGQAAAASHTGALAGSDLVYDAAIRRAGMLRVDTLEELFAAAETLAHFQHLPAGGPPGWVESLTLLTNGGGAGVLAADAAARAGVALAPLGAGTRSALDRVLPTNWSRANPIDIIGDAPVERYVRALRALLDDPESGTILLMHSPTAIVPSAAIAQALVPLGQAAPGRLLGCWIGDAAVQEARACFRAAGVPCYERPEEAVRAFSMLVDYRHNQQELTQTPASAGPWAQGDRAAVAALVDRVLAAGREMLTEPEAKALLAAAGVPVVSARVTEPEPEAAVIAAREIGYPVVLKVLSPEISHKSDVGGVELDLQDDESVRRAVVEVLGRVARQRPGARVTGFSLQAMVRRPRALELIVGTSIDEVFGPVILFGQGGTAVEVVADRAIALPPLNAPLARALVSRTRVARLLAGWRDVPAADMGAIVAVLRAISELLAAEPRIAEIDINPLLADAQGVVALDARVRVSAAAPGGAAHFAILPYPTELEEPLTWQGRNLTLRPIRPEDEAQHRAFLERLDPEDIRMRIFQSRRSIEHSELARLTQIDYGREMAFIAAQVTAGGDEETLGVVRALCDPDNVDAEFGILVRSDLKGSGLGERLLHKMVVHLQTQGTRRLVATVLAENGRMLQLARDMGFELGPSQDGVRAIALRLT